MKLPAFLIISTVLTALLFALVTTPTPAHAAITLRQYNHPYPSCTPKPTPTYDYHFPSCEDKSSKPGDKAHYIDGMHQIVGGSLLTGSDDVYTLKNNNYLQCFCPAVGKKGIQTNWLRTDTAITNWFFVNGTQWGLGNVTYAAQNKNFTCESKERSWDH